jgi:hypothetical protein
MNHRRAGVGSDTTKTAAVHMGGPAAGRATLTVAGSDSRRVGHERGPSRIHLVGVVQGGVEGQEGLKHLCAVGGELAGGGIVTCA